MKKKKNPIYFHKYSNFNSYLSHFKKFIIENNLLLRLKVNVEKFNQIPDYNMLHIDFQWEIIGNTFYIYNNDLIEKNIFKKFLNGEYYEIPFSKLKYNDDYQQVLINLTNTFSINKKIPPENIIDWKII